jgi:hypothetical protein
MWILAFSLFALIKIFRDYRKYRFLYLDPREKTEIEERREKRAVKWRPYYLPIYSALYYAKTMLKLQALEIHEYLLEYTLYWKIMKVSFRLQTAFYNFQGDKNPGPIRRFVANTMYHYPKAICLVILIIEPFIHGQLIYLRSYLGIMFFLYLILRLGNYWSLEYYRWLGPIIIKTLPYKVNFDPSAKEYSWFYYTELDLKGNLIIKEDPQKAE